MLSKILACSAAISFTLLACGDTSDTSDNSDNTKTSISCVQVENELGEEILVEEMPVMDSRVRYYEYAAFPPTPPDDKEWGYSLGNFNDIGINIITDKDMLMQAFPYISDNEQTECNYFAVYFWYHYGHRDDWILSEDMVLHQIVPKQVYIACTVPGVSEPIVSPVCVVPLTGGTSIAAMLVCDDTPEGNLKDRINIDSIRSHAVPNWACSD